MKIWDKIIGFFSEIFSILPNYSKKKLLEINSKHLKRKVFIELYLPETKKIDWPLLILNDGQDAAALNLSTIHQTYCEKRPLLIAAIHAFDRLAEYGTPDILDCKGRGQKSAAYQQFIVDELLPKLKSSYPLASTPNKIGIAGFSLGGLSAIAIALNNSNHFGMSGVFSGALWWRSKAFEKDKPDANRIIHAMANQIPDMEQNQGAEEQRFWFQAGTEDEQEDRNNNGVIDAIDDSLDLIEILKRKIPNDDHHLKYVEVENGRHEPATWSKELPGFLEWGFG